MTSGFEKDSLMGGTMMGSAMPASQGRVKQNAAHMPVRLHRVPASVTGLLLNQWSTARLMQRSML